MINISVKLKKRLRLVIVLIILAVILGIISRKVLGIVFGTGNLAVLIYLIANKKSRFRKCEIKEKAITIVTLVIMSIVFFCVAFPKTGKNTVLKNNNSSTNAAEGKSSSERLVIDYIDVGQGDSILIQQGSKTMLIDTGTSASKEMLISSLKNHKIKKLDYLILTHPHEDHIGGASEVVKDFKIGTVYMPKVTTNTNTFKELVSEMNSKGIKASQPDLQTKFNFGKASCIIYGPVNPKSEDLNTYSIVMKITFGNKKFLFEGDAQSSNEKGMLDKGYDLSADVLKVGHHGSSTSSSEAFLKAVKPSYAVISCGKGNDYLHPHSQTMQRLKNLNIKVYRTDENGSIECITDGKNIKFNKDPGDYDSGTQLKNKKTSETNTKSQNGSNTSKGSAAAKKSSKTSNTEDTKQYVDSKGNGLIKGNINSKGQKIYHLPGDKYYNQTKAEKMFKTIKEAEAAGYRASN